jgi:hypothetical protein
VYLTLNWVGGGAPSRVTLPTLGVLRGSGVTSEHFCSNLSILSSKNDKRLRFDHFDEFEHVSAQTPSKLLSPWPHYSAP